MFSKILPLPIVWLNLHNVSLILRGVDLNRQHFDRNVNMVPRKGLPLLVVYVPS